MGMADYYEGPIEDENWLGIRHGRFPGSAKLSKHLITEEMQSVDVTYAEEWKFDHGIIVPLHFLTPARKLTIIPANINCQGPPLTPLHCAWAFGEALLAYTDGGIYQEAGQGGFEIRTMIAISGLCAGSKGEIWCYQPIPIFAVGCTIGVMSLPT